MIDHGQRTPLLGFQPAGSAGAVALRGVSFGIAATLIALLSLAPWMFAGETTIVHVIMPVMALGLAGAFAHVVGYRPRSTILAAILGPWVSWPLMLSSLALLAFRLS